MDVDDTVVLCGEESWADISDTAVVRTVPRGRRINGGRFRIDTGDDDVGDDQQGAQR